MGILFNCDALIHSKGSCDGKPAAVKKVLNYEVINEIEIMRSLPKNTNIVDCFGTKIGLNHSLIALELCDYSLHDEIESQDGIGPLSLQRLLECFRLGMEFLYEEGIVHADIKPQNVLSQNSVYKIGDFGLSKFAAKDQGLQSAGGSFNYCHPSVLASNYWDRMGFDKSPVGLLPRQIDLYSIGVTLYKSVSNKLPFHATSYLAMYELITLKPPNAVRGIELDSGVFWYDSSLSRSSLVGAQKKGIEKLIVKLLKVCKLRAELLHS